MSINKYNCNKHGEVEGLQLEVDVEGWTAGQVVCSKCMMENVLKGLVPLEEPVPKQKIRRAFSENEITSDRCRFKRRRKLPQLSTE